MRVKDLTIVSLSRGLLGENFIRHELEIGLRRLEAYGIRVHFAEHALSGLEYTAEHPEKRAEDLLNAMKSDTDMILCAVGGDDTYRLLPYLFDHGELERARREGVERTGKEKIFLGFSDTTMNHLMLHKVGLNTFYGQAFLPDVCELDTDMLPYTRKFFEELISTGHIAEVRPSDIWYESREDFSEACIGTSLPQHENHGFELLQGSPVFSGMVLGGCIDTLYDLFDGDRYADSPALCEKYGLFPSLEDWQDKILLLESSEERPAPELYEKMLRALKKTGVFGAVSGVLIGKPYNEQYFDEYRKLLTDVIADPSLPVVVNVNVGHALPRCILPFGVPAEVNIPEQVIRFVQ